MVEKMVETTTEAASSYFNPYLIGLALIGGGVLASSLWYCFAGHDNNDTPESIEKSRKDYCEKLKKQTDEFLLNPHEKITHKSLRIAANLCGEVDKFDLTQSDNYSLNMKLIKLEKEIETIRSEKEYVRKNLESNSSGIV